MLQDAYAHHVPLVVSDVGALGETVRDDRTGWVVTPGDVDGLAATLLAAIRDDAGPRARPRPRCARSRARRGPPALVGRASSRAVYERRSPRR